MPRWEGTLLSLLSSCFNDFIVEWTGNVVCELRLDFTKEIFSSNGCQIFNEVETKDAKSASKNRKEVAKKHA